MNQNIKFYIKSLATCGVKHAIAERSSFFGFLLYSFLNTNRKLELEKEITIIR